jgi:hypothetical protein
MKKSILFLFIFISSLALAQSSKPEKLSYLKINQKVCSNQKGFQLVFKGITSDSRCPKGVTCIWAGAVTAIVSVYEDGTLLENTTLVFSIKNTDENKKWFARYLPKRKKNIKMLQIVPYPKSGVTINPRDYRIKIGYIK